MAMGPANATSIRVAVAKRAVRDSFILMVCSICLVSLDVI
jgi:hypothetical protein